MQMSESTLQDYKGSEEERSTQFKTLGKAIHWKGPWADFLECR